MNSLFILLIPAALAVMIVLDAVRPQNSPWDAEARGGSWSGDLPGEQTEAAPERRGAQPPPAASGSELAASEASR